MFALKFQNIFLKHDRSERDTGLKTETTLNKLKLQHETKLSRSLQSVL